MNKQELIKLVAEETEISQKDVAKVLDAIIKHISIAVASGITVLLVGFGSFKPAKREARNGRNPQTGEAIEIPARIVPVFRPGKEFKQAVAGE